MTYSVFQYHYTQTKLRNKETKQGKVGQ